MNVNSVTLFKGTSPTYCCRTAIVQHGMCIFISKGRDRISNLCTVHVLRGLSIVTRQTVHILSDGQQWNKERKLLELVNISILCICIHRHKVGLFTNLTPNNLPTSDLYLRSFFRTELFYNPQPTIISFPWIWKGVCATLQSGRYTLSYPRGRYIRRCTRIL